jgi:hypothetical protein
MEWIDLAQDKDQWRALVNKIMNLLKLNSVALIRKRTIPAERRLLSAKLVPDFADRGCRVVSATDPHGR